MKRFGLRESDGDEGGVDMSPLIDCVFILLIFFIVTTVFVEEKGVEVDKPQAAASASDENNSILIAITEDGRILHEQTNLGLSGIQSLVRRKIRQEDVPVIIQSDKNSNAGLMVRVIDEAKLGGATKVSIGTIN
ncbi:MAG: biopolymer transporter ExbD [Verrucomicrobiota bacterium]